MSTTDCCRKVDHCSPHASHQVKSKNAERFDRAIRFLEKVSAVALGILAAVTDLRLFVPSFAFGAAIGIYQHYSETQNKRHHAMTSSCSQGFMESLTGIKLPPVVSLVANIAVTVCHIDHHSSVFVPIIGVSIGAWVGKTTAECTSLMFRKFKPVGIVSHNHRMHACA